LIHLHAASDYLFGIFKLVFFMNYILIETSDNIIYSYKYLESDLIKHCHVIFIHSLDQPLIVRSHSKEIPNWASRVSNYSYFLDSTENKHGVQRQIFQHLVSIKNSALASARHFRHWRLIFESDEYFPYPIRHLNFQKIVKKNVCNNPFFFICWLKLISHYNVHFNFITCYKPMIIEFLFWLHNLWSHLDKEFNQR
jgi:hypothetical protein